MATLTEEKTDFKVQHNNRPLIRDHNTNSGALELKKSCQKPLLDPKAGGEGGNELQSVKKSILCTKDNTEEQLPDSESAYAESFCSDESYQEDSEITNVTADSSLSNFTSLHRSESSQSNLKRLACVQLSKQKRINSASQTFDTKSLSIEEGMKLLNLNTPHPDDKCNKRKNMSFTNNETFKIERDNELLLRRIMMQQRPSTHCKAKIQSTPSRLSSSAINRKKFQRKIEEDNMMLLRRLQRAKPCITLNTKTPGYRMTKL